MSKFSRSTTLSRTHYAGAWVIPSEEDRNDLNKINQLGRTYAVLADGPEKEALLFQILKAFHPYLMKYVTLIVRGNLPPTASRARTESMSFLRMFTVRDSEDKYSPQAYRRSCKMLHRAFKSNTTDAIYDELALCFLSACRRFDPHHADKVRKVCEVISGLDATKSFTVATIDGGVGFDSLSILRALVRKGFLSSAPGYKKTVRYQRNQWPPEPSFFESGPIGFTFVVQMWFRFHLAQYVRTKLLEVETSGKMLELEAFAENGSDGADDVEGPAEVLLPNPEGNCVSATGHFRFMADTELMNRQWDVSDLCLDWIADCEDKLFKRFNNFERVLLWERFTEDVSWRMMGRMHRVDSATVHRWVDEIIDTIRYQMGLPRL